jgi:hypothetical protein
VKVEILDQAITDLIAGHRFYESQSLGLGAYFLDALFSDIDSLQLYAGIHPVFFGHHRMLSKRFPFAIYYQQDGDVVRVYAVLDCRNNPSTHEGRLKKS